MQDFVRYMMFSCLSTVDLSYYPLGVLQYCLVRAHIYVAGGTAVCLMSLHTRLP